MKRTGVDRGPKGVRLSRRELLVTSGALAASGGLAACLGTGGPGAHFEDRPDGGPGTPFDAGAVAGIGATKVAITVEGDFRLVRSNGIPDHPTGTFPNAHCPSGIRPQRYDFRMRAEPEAAPSFVPIEMWIFGVAVNGVPFDPAGPYYRERDTNWHFEVMSPVASPYLGLDDAHAHTQMGGSYHYHGLPQRFLGSGTARSMALVGWAADGFPIYAPWAPSDPLDPESSWVAPRPSYRLKAGTRETGPGGRYDGTFVQDYEFDSGIGDLDEANGRFGVTPEYEDGIYHYFLTEAFPFIPRFYRGIPDPSFEHPHPPGTMVVGPLPRELWNYRG